MIKKTLNISIIILSVFCNFIFANEQQPPTQDQALLDIKVGIELSKFEQSAANIDQSIALASKALQDMAKNPNMNEQQQAQVITIFEHIDELALRFQDSIEALPGVIHQSTPPITIAIDNLFSNIQLTIIIVLFSLLLLIIAAFIVVYYWLLKPTSLMLLKTTAQVDKLASTLQDTAKIVDKNAEQQLLILNAFPRKE